MKVYNTMTREKEEFVPLEEGKVKMYVCGPTVYDKIHIGNARPICVFDTLRRYLEYKGYDVTFVQNFTDIDDKIIARANEEGISSKEHAEKYIGEYYTDTQGLGIRRPDIEPKATETMDEIIEFVQHIVDSGYGYEKNGNVYFRAGKYDEYGKLSRQPLDELEMGARISTSDEKEDPLDFVLWKPAKAGEPAWDSPWGKGRPGWHIECSAMVKKHLGESIDIHGGGRDLIFPHHENEIAQSECCGHVHNYVKYWMHNGYINIDNKKMSKSLGNFFTVREIADKYGYEPIKYMMLQAHYRSPINYNLEIITQCQNALERLHTSRNNLDFALKNADDTNTAGSAEFLEKLKAREAQFVEAMDDDLNTADGIAAIFELARDCNSYTAEPRPSSDIKAAIALFDRLCDVMGILYNRESGEIDKRIQELIEKRQQARADKNWALADEIRDTLKAEGVVLEDTPQGVKYTIVK